MFQGEKLPQNLASRRQAVMAYFVRVNKFNYYIFGFFAYRTASTKETFVFTFPGHNFIQERSCGH